MHNDQTIQSNNKSKSTPKMIKTKTIWKHTLHVKLMYIDVVQIISLYANNINNLQVSINH